jgi:MFS family permease
MSQPEDEDRLKGLARSMAGVAVAGLALPGSKDDHSGAQIDARQVPTAFRAFWADGFFAAAQDAFILAYLPLLAHALGASALEIGLLSASMNLGAMLALYPGAIAARRATSRRWVVVFYAGIIGRLLLLGTALAVAFLTGKTALYLVIVLFTARAFIGNYTVPAWTSLAADVIPEHLRARYFASRNFAISGATLAITPLGGLLLDRGGFPGGYVAALTVSFVLGMGATIAYACIPEPPARPEKKQRRPIRPRAMLANHRFRAFVLATFCLHFATMIAGPFFNVYLRNQLGASNFSIGWLSTASAMAGLVGQLICGELMFRRGALWLTRATMLVFPALPLMWLFVDAPWMVLAPNIVGGFAWAAFNLANFQLLLEITEEGEREEYVAAFHMAMFAALFAAPFVGGAIIDLAGYKTAFLVSGLARFVSAGLFFFAVGVPAFSWMRRRKAAAEG